MTGRSTIKFNGRDAVAGAYYNEIDPYAAEWLRNLIRDGHIAPGDVDTRSIEDVKPDDLRGYTQCHFFAGLGLWSYALRRAGWSDERRIWTGSCPCQPFSSAGKGDGFGDERHLWPAFAHLVAQCGPPVVCGEQVASKDGYAWLDLVQTDMEGLAYAFWPVVLPVAGVGGPGERHRIWWVGMADPQSENRRPEQSAGGARRRWGGFAGSGTMVGMAHTASERRGETGRAEPTGRQPIVFADSGARTGRVGYAERPRLERHAGNGDGAPRREAPERPTTAANLSFRVADDGHRFIPQPVGRPQRRDGGAAISASDGVAGLSRIRVAYAHGEYPGTQRRDDSEGPSASGGSLRKIDTADVPYGYSLGVDTLDGGAWPGPLNGFWRNADWLFCTDGKWRPVEPGTRPLAYGLPLGMGVLGAGLERLCTVAGITRDSLDRAKKYRVGTLRGYGNAISPEPAIAFIESWRDVAP